MGNKSWFSLVHFFFQLNPYDQPRVWSNEKHNKPHGSCYTPELCFRALNPNYLSKRLCVLCHLTPKWKFAFGQTFQWTLWSCWKIGHKLAMWFSEPTGYSYNLKLPKANAATQCSDPTPSLPSQPHACMSCTHPPRLVQPSYAANYWLRNRSFHPLFSFKLPFFFFSTESVPQSAWSSDHINSCISTRKRAGEDKRDSIFQQGHQQNAHWNTALGSKCKHKELVLWLIL